MVLYKALAPTTRMIFLSSLLFVLVFLVYCNSLHADFVLDDEFNVLKNPLIRHLLWNTQGINNVMIYHTMTHRPLVVETFALNYAVDGVDPFGYHLTNIAIHITNTILAFMLMQQIFRTQGLSVHFGTHAVPLAFTIALLWGVHPLNTNAITYISQRFESLMSTFYLLTLYAWLRRWFALAVVTSVLGMISKEIMVTVPVMIVLLDVGFITRSWRETLSQRWRALAVLTSVVITIAGRDLLFLPKYMAGVGLGGQANFWPYITTEPHAVLHYLWLIFWPSPLIFDYGWPAATGLKIIVPTFMVVILLVLALWGVVQKQLWAPPLAAYFVILAPSSSFIPIFGDYYDEYRAYLPSLAIVAAIVVTAQIAMRHFHISPRWGVVLATGMAVILGGLTLRRNEDYRSGVTLWADTVQKSPENPRAYNNLGNALINKQDWVGAEQAFRASIKLWPDFAEPHNNLGLILSRRGDLVGAEREYRESIRSRNTLVEAHNNLGQILGLQKDFVGAEQEFRFAVMLEPYNIPAHHNLAVILHQQGNLPAAEQEFLNIIHLSPENGDTHAALGSLYLEQGKTIPAEQELREAIRLQPAQPDAYSNLGVLFQRQGDLASAEQNFQEALRIQPNHADAHSNLGWVLKLQGHIDTAEHELREALRIDPHHVNAHNNLGVVLVELGRLDAAEHEFHAVLAIDPNNINAHSNLAQLFADRNDTEAEQAELREVKRLQNNPH